MDARNKAFDQMQQYGESNDAERIHAGLIAITWSPDVPVDFTRIPSAIRHHLQHPDPSTRSWALNALSRAGYEAEDEARVLSMVQEVDRRTVGAIVNAVGFLSKRDFTGKHGPPMLLGLPDTEANLEDHAFVAESVITLLAGWNDCLLVGLKDQSDWEPTCRFL